MLRRIYFLARDFLFDLIFPCFCVGCGVEGDWICPDCLKKIDIIKQPFCPECRRPTRVGEFCGGCRSRFVLDGIFICANLEEGALKEAVHQFKYGFISDIGKGLGRLMAGKLRAVSCSKCHLLWGGGLGFDYIIPVPLHEKRKRWRGFNQAEILGCELSQISREFYKWRGVSYDDKILLRKKHTRPQMELGREERLENLKGGFVVETCHGMPLQGKNILLVDDITTTGATLEECAKALKKAGAEKVWGIVLAKGK